MKTLRLLLFSDCNRNCEKCCNKGFDLDNLPVETDFTKYAAIMLTGGEPMLAPLRIAKAIREINLQTNTPIYLYTAKVDNTRAILLLLQYLAGITVTLHTQKDVANFAILSVLLSDKDKRKSLHLNIFDGIDIAGIDTEGWTVKAIKWLDNCPLPENEVFCRYDKGVK